ncbi:PREDICTED: homeobox protein TGIF2LX [Chinchilla lanigera]|uniref:homeobox protein TGIF2LX n=1 Tax=Chinchilla lanigera TaxID=34839 RepID=UPI00038EEB01|nr:PREDICTED: homeobox protein TGIF2LX [Chinchilla lanigera]
MEDALASPENKRRKKGHLPAESEKILRDWFYEHQFKAYPSEADKRMLSEKTNLPFLQIFNWFVNTRQQVLAERLKEDVNDSKHQKDKDTDETQLPNTDSSFLVKSGPVDPDKVQCRPLSPLLRGRDSGKNLPGPETSSSQKCILKAPLKEVVEISTSEPMSFPESVQPEEYKDFSNFYLLVDVAVQRAAELELQEKQEHDA